MEVVAFAFEPVGFGTLTRGRDLVVHVEHEHDIGREALGGDVAERGDVLDAEPTHDALVHQR